MGTWHDHWLNIISELSFTFITSSTGDALLTPTILYSNAIQALMAAGSRDVPILLAAAHITGGGIEENISRVFAERSNCMARVDANKWRMPEVRIST